MSSIELMILDVGHGNSALIIEPGQVTLIDAALGRTVSEALKQAGIRVVNNVLISHADADHCGGLIGLLLDKDLLIERVVLNSDAAKATQAWEDLLRALRDARTRTNTRLSVELTSDSHPAQEHQEFRLEVLAPAPTIAAKGAGSRDHDGRRLTSNSMSAVIRVWRKNVPIALFPGDLDRVGLFNLLTVEPVPRAQVLVFPHHGGSPTGSDARLFAAHLCNAVQPDVVVFSLARGKFGTPRPEIIEGVREALPNAHILCTQLSERCAVNLPQNSPSHLSGRASRGSHVTACCGGTLILDSLGSSILAAPTIKAHREFVQLNAPTAMCRHRIPPN